MSQYRFRYGAGRHEGLLFPCFGRWFPAAATSTMRTLFSKAQSRASFRWSPGGLLAKISFVQGPFSLRTAPLAKVSCDMFAFRPFRGRLNSVWKSPTLHFLSTGEATGARSRTSTESAPSICLLAEALHLDACHPWRTCHVAGRPCAKSSVGRNLVSQKPGKSGGPSMVLTCSKRANGAGLDAAKKDEPARIGVPLRHRTRHPYDISSWHTKSRRHEPAWWSWRGRGAGEPTWRDWIGERLP